MDSVKVTSRFKEQLLQVEIGSLVTGYTAQRAARVVKDYLRKNKYLSDLSPREHFVYNTKVLEVLGIGEIWGSIRLKQMSYYSCVPEITDNLMFPSRWASNSEYMSDGKFCYHIPIKNKLDLEPTLQKLRQWCPSIIVEHTYTVTDKY